MFYISFTNSLRIISGPIVIPFHRFSQSRIARILLSSNATFSFVALYLKTKTRNWRKVSFTVSVLDSGYNAQIDCSLPMFIYTADYFSNLLLSISTFFKQKIGKTFRQFRIFAFAPMPENENAESAESSIKFSLLFQRYLLIKY